MTTPSAMLASATTSAKPRARGFPVLSASLRESQAVIGAGAFYIIAISLLVGLLIPAFKTLNVAGYLSNPTIGAIVGTAGLPPSSTFATLLAFELYSSFFLLLFGGVLAYVAGASIARNVEDGTIDITLARPVSRARFYLEKWAAVLVGGLLLIGVSLLAAWLDTLIYAGATLDWQWFLRAHLDIAALFVFVAGAGLLISSVLSAGRLAGGLAVMIPVVGYLCQTFSGTGDKLTFLKYLSPYYYAPSATTMILEQQSGEDIWKLVGLAAVGVIAALVGLVLFQRRDITV